jgi:hypothetical protein
VALTTQSNFPDMDASSAGLMHEQTFNEYLAAALRKRRNAWRDDETLVISERQQVFEDDRRARPDILVKSADFYPIIIEAEFGSPAIADARSRLGKRVAGIPGLVRSAIALGIPPEVRRWSNDFLAERLAQPDGLKLQYVILSSDISGDLQDPPLMEDGIHIWPETDAIAGTVDDLAILCEYAAAPQELVTRTTDEVAARIHSLSDYLYRALPPGVADDIAQQLGQQGGIQGLRLACCIWLTSLRLHNLLASKSPALRKNGLQSVAQLLTVSGNVLTLAGLRREWDKILAVNYSSIFNTARIALDDRIPVLAGSQVLTELAELAERITSLNFGNRIDFAGELFPKLLDDREEIAAHYTLPETAELLGQLAVSRIALNDWASADAVASLKIADLACGTGTLLRAAYRHIRYRHEASGGASEDLHRRMIEQSITGLDINSLASHMTAAALSTTEIETAYDSAHIAVVDVIGGKTGSLELIEDEQITDVTGEQARTATTHEAAPTFIPVPHHSQNLIIQNPPYSRPRGDRKLFDITGITEAQRNRSVKRLNKIRTRLRTEGNEIIDGQAGLGTDFFALADRKLEQDGIFASVLPLTAAHAESWEGFRKTIESEYTDITTIAVTPHEGAMLSADTHMNEMLVLATKGAGGKDTKEGAASPSVLNINLHAYPRTVSEAYWFAKTLIAIDASTRTSGTILVGGERIGAWTVTTNLMPGFPWFAAGMRNHILATTAGSLLRSELYSAADLRSWDLGMPMTSLQNVVDIGPTHHLIGHVRNAREEIGAFTFYPVTPMEVPVSVYLALWAADGNSQTTMLTLPTHNGEVFADDEDALRRMIDQRSDLFISRTLRTTSQALAAAKTLENVMGGRAWTSLMCNDDDVKSALLIWCNSTLGLLTRNCYAQTTQQGRATMGVIAIADFPVPDFSIASAAGEHARSVARDRIEELSALRLQPVAYSFQDANRHRIDEVALEMLGLDGEDLAAGAVAALRNQLCREPSVHGGSPTIMRALGIAQ